MATNLARLEAENSRLHKQLLTSERKIKRFSERSKKSFSSLGKSVAGLAGAFSGVALVTSVIDTAPSFEKLEASLETVTGSAQRVH